MQVRCLHCHEPTEVATDSDLGQIVCASCGGRFSIVPEETSPYHGTGTRKLGRFELLEQVGAGAFGAVWKARDPELDRIVAVKVPRKDALPAKEAELFFREARAAAQLKHPSIVSVHEVGRDEDRVYIVSDFVRGATLDDWLTSRRTSPREAATLCAAIADALDHAHQAGVIHRDLKPGNVMMDLEGRPHLMDFGLARRLAGEATMTVAGRILGTPAYMSPEQARGESHAADARTDVYSLGVILFKLLTGELPFRGSAQMLVVQILKDEPPSPRKLNHAIPRDLETICLKAMAKEPARRYQTARDLATDLRRWLAGESIRARPVGPLERAWRWTRRRPALAALIALSSVLALTIVGGSLIYSVKLGAALDTTKRREAEARTERQRAVTNLYHSLVRETQALREARREGYRTLAWQRLSEALKLDTPDKNVAELRQEAVACLGDFVGREPTVWTDCAGKATAIAVHPRGELVAIGLADGGIVMRERVTGKDTTVLRGHRGPIRALQFTPDGRRLISGAADRTLRIWDRMAPTSWSSTKTIDVSAGVAAGAILLEVSADGRRVATGTFDGPTVALWNLDDGARRATFSVPSGERLRGIVVSPYGDLVGAIQLGPPNYAGTLLVWDAATQKQKWTIKPNLTVLNAAAFSADGRYLACTGSGGTEVFDTTTAQLQSAARGDLGHSVALTGDGRRLAIARRQAQTVLLWDHALHREEATLQMASFTLRVALSADGQTLAALCDREVRVDLGGDDEKRALPGHARGVTYLAYSADDKRLASTSHDGSVRIRDAARGQSIKELASEAGVQAVAWGRDDRVLATSYLNSNEVRIWDTTTWQALTLTDHGLRAPIYGVGFSPDGHYFAAGGYGGVNVWSIDVAADQVGPDMSLRHVARFEGQGTASMLFSPDGRTLAWVSFVGAPGAGAQVRIADVATWRERPFAAPTLTHIQGLAFAPDGKRLFLVNPRHEIETWQVDTGERLAAYGAKELQATAINTTKLTLTADGKFLAVGNKRITIWDTEKQSLLISLPMERSSIWSMAWSPDGSELAVGFSDGSAAIWNVPRVRALLAEIGLDW